MKNQVNGSESNWIEVVVNQVGEIIGVK